MTNRHNAEISRKEIIMKKTALFLAFLAGASLAAAEALTVEAESGKGDPALTLVKESADASGGKVVVMNKLLPKDSSGSCWQVNITAPKTASYRIKFRYIATQSSNDSVFWAVNGGPYRQFAGKIAPEGNESGAGIIALKQGENTLTFRTRERGFQLDRITAVPVK